MILKRNSGFKLEILPNAKHFIKKLKDKTLKNRIKIAILNIKTNPYNSKPMSGKFKGYNRIKVGNYRIIFKIDNKASNIIVFTIRSREKSYKK
jgi:mRNA-degrading endonuclease RelE of RelBE toxin-antitoxin system